MKKSIVILFFMIFVGRYAFTENNAYTEVIHEKENKITQSQVLVASLNDEEEKSFIVYEKESQEEEEIVSEEVYGEEVQEFTEDFTEQNSDEHDEYQRQTLKSEDKNLLYEKLNGAIKEIEGVPCFEEMCAKAQSEAVVYCDDIFEVLDVEPQGYLSYKLNECVNLLKTVLNVYNYETSNQ